MSEIQNFYDTHSITVKGDNVPKPVFNFNEAGFSGDVLLCTYIIENITQIKYILHNVMST